MGKKKTAIVCKRRRLIKRLAACAMILAALYVACGFVAAGLFYSQNFSRKEASVNDFTMDLVYADIDKNKYPRTEFRFPSDKNELVGYEYGAENARGLVLISSGYGGTGDSYMGFVTRFVGDGYRVITYDMTGVAKSGGGNMRGVCQGAIDMDALLSHVERQPCFDDLPIFLLGHSWGGYAVCAALARPHRVKAVVSIAGYGDAGEFLKAWVAKKAGAWIPLLAPHLWVMQRAIFGSSMNVTAADGINASDARFLIIQGRSDGVVDAGRLSVYAHRAEAAGGNAEYLLMDGGHRPFVSQAAKDYQKKMQASWAAYSKRRGISAGLGSGGSDRLRAAKFAWAKEAGLDKARYNEIDEEIMKRIDALFF